MNTISQALEQIGYPVCHPPYGGGARKYLTYQLIGQIGAIYAEGKEAATGTTFGLDFFTDTPPFAPDLAAIKAALEAEGYVAWVETEQYEAATGLWHVAMTAVCPGGVYG